MSIIIIIVSELCLCFYDNGEYTGSPSLQLCQAQSWMSVSFGEVLGFRAVKHWCCL